MFILLLRELCAEFAIVHSVFIVMRYNYRKCEPGGGEEGEETISNAEVFLPLFSPHTPLITSTFLGYPWLRIADLCETSA